MKSVASDKSRHLLLRADAGDLLPDALVASLDQEQVACGWYRASGVLDDVELRALGAAATFGSAGARKIAGRVQVALLEGSIGLAGTTLSIGMRAVLARETDRGLETLAGEIVSARIVALEAHVIAFDDLSLPRTLDAATGVWLLGGPAGGPGATAAKSSSAASTAAEPPPRPVQSKEVLKPSAWADAAHASAASHAPATSGTTADAAHRAPAPPPAIAITTPPATPAAPAAAVTPSGTAMPLRIVRPRVENHDPTPDAGDFVDHFAFGPCDVVKSDGDRLHLRVHKDGRIKEIATEMLRVTLLGEENGHKRFKLERRL